MPIPLDDVSSSTPTNGNGSSNHPSAHGSGLQLVESDEPGINNMLCVPVSVDKLQFRKSYVLCLCVWLRDSW